MPRTAQPFQPRKLRRSPRSRIGYTDTLESAKPVSTEDSVTRAQALAKSALAMGTGDDISALSATGRKSRLLLDSDAARIVAIIVIIVCIVVVTRTFVYATNTETVPLPQPTQSDSNAGGTGQEDTQHTESSGSSTSPVQVPAPQNSNAAPSEATVYLTGAVANPGIFTLPENSRVNDAVVAAGGLTDAADTRHINLAALIADGEHIHITATGEETETQIETNGGAATPATVDINSANQQTLETVPGIGPATAGAIIKWRESNGKFADIESLTNVPGIGTKTVERLREYLRAG